MQFSLTEIQFLLTEIRCNKNYFPLTEIQGKVFDGISILTNRLSLTERPDFVNQIQVLFVKMRFSSKEKIVEENSVFVNKKPLFAKEI